MKPPCGVVAFLTDFGTKDPYVAAMRGVALSINPRVVLVDVTHEIPSFDIDEAAFTLLTSYRYFPPGTVFVVVVDPGVGSGRRALAIATRNYYFVGPDNGVLLPAAQDDGVELVVELTNPEYWRHPVSASFHGRDIFTPVAAWITLGVPLRAFGRVLTLEDLAKPSISIWARAVGSCVELRVIHIDKFGNVILSQRFEDLAKILGLELGSRIVVENERGQRFEARVLRVFSEAGGGELVLYRDSFDFAELAVNAGSARDLLGVCRGSRLLVCRA